jgi:hypothetical protein
MPLVLLARPDGLSAPCRDSPSFIGQKTPAALLTESAPALGFAAGKKRGFCPLGQPTRGAFDGIRASASFGAGKKRGFCPLGQPIRGAFDGTG